MPHQPVPSRSVHRRRTALGVASLLPALVLVPGPASAHDSLISSDPADGAVVPGSPDSLTLTYSAEILPQGTAVTVTDAAGTEWVEGDPQVSGASLVVDLRDGLPPGEYSTVWRVVSSDGHPIDGVQTFTVEAGPDADATTTTITSAEGQDDPSAVPTGEAPSPTERADQAAGDPSASTDAAATETIREDGGWGRTALVAGIGALAALAMAAAAIRLRGRSPQDHR